METLPASSNLAYLFQIRASKPDLFYQILTKLTNTQLEKLCLADQKDPKKKGFCQRKLFWENLWRSRFANQPPEGNLKQLRQAYLEANLLESLVEEIASDLALSLALHEVVFQIKHEIDSEYENEDTDLNYLVQKARREYVEAQEKDFRKNWNRQAIRRTLEDPEINLLSFALKFSNPNLIKYSLLNQARLGDLYLNTLSHEKLINSALDDLEPITRLPLVREAKLDDILRRRTTLQNRILLAFLQRYPNQIKTFLEKYLDYYEYEKQFLKGLGEIITTLPEEEIETYRKSPAIQKSLLRFYLLRPEEVEPTLIESRNETLIKILLQEYDIDLGGLLSELMDRGLWIALKRILLASSTLKKEYDPEYQAGLYSFYLDFLDQRNERKETDIDIWGNSDRYSDSGDYNMETIILESLQGPYLFKALQKSLSDSHFPLDYLQELLENQNFFILEEAQVESLIRQLEKQNPRRAKKFRSMLPS